ncbi:MULTISPECIES: cbb3-type cytochrome c oxidase N-terminal domain-containing protein [Sphingobacterium]|uniref:cbb3-type cytochrome c oxidase N-terminal domain-containing protein n=1 Tax=Sphingobacterium TaxID=28453 RepID=UPI001F0952FB|nr:MULTISPECIES: cbb3-type cytochrome c oxidase N-terminal domain-containing protein [unclassified Sphingobacterium]
MSLFLMAAEPVEGVTQWKFGAADLYSDILIIALIVVMITLLFSAIVVNKAMKSILRLTMPELAKQEDEIKRLAKAQGKGRWGRIWSNLLELRPIEEEKDMVIDHEYDGIQELNNPIPTWFNALFYSTVLFGFVYLLVYHVFGWGMNQDQEYLQELAVAEKTKQEYLAQTANLIDESSVLFDAALAPAGKAIFAVNCVACHGGNGEGGIGPNLTDRFWIHGGEIKDVFKTVKYGVPEKGMVPWEQTLTPGQIAEVSSYILTLRDTKPANAKASEGVEIKAYESEGGSADDANKTTTDSTANK